MYDFSSIVKRFQINGEFVSCIRYGEGHINETYLAKCDSANGKVDYALAKSYKIDKTDREMTINLRKTYWSDSKLVTADDVLFAWQRILDPAFENPAAALPLTASASPSP